MGASMASHRLSGAEGAFSSQALYSLVDHPHLATSSSCPSAFAVRKQVNAVDWVWYPGKDAGKMVEKEVEETPANPTERAFGEEPDLTVDEKEVMDREQYDDEMRIQAKGLLDDHGIPANPGLPPSPHGNQVWRCVPMDQIDLGGPEAAAQSGAALYEMKAKPDGKIGIQVPERPPIFNPPLLGGPDEPKTDLKGIKGAFKQVLRDPAGNWYWVMTATGEVARSQRHLLKTEFGPVEQTSGVSTMLCHEGKQSHWEEPVIAPGLFELQKRATNFLEVVGPLELRRSVVVS